MASLLAMIGLAAVLAGPETDGPVVVARLTTNERYEVELAELVSKLADVAGLEVKPARVSLRLPMAGLGGPISRRVLAETLGDDVRIDLAGRELVLSIPTLRVAGPARDDWQSRLDNLVTRLDRVEKIRNDYGMHALKSYRPNDPGRPTVCLIHGLNSTSSVFWHMIAPIEAAGYGVVVYDFPYNRDLDETSEAFRRDWAEFRKAWGEARPWGIVAHSMGSLLARSYVEDDRSYGNDVASLILIAPVNRGSNLSRVQTLLQMSQGLKALNGGGGRRGDPLALLGDGLGAAADDMMPGSAFLNGLNARKPRPGVPYHILAGDGGFLTTAARRQIETQLGTGGRSGLLGGLARLATSGLAAQLDEITEGLGDGCVAVSSTRIDGVDVPVVLHVNHLELIRAPLLFPDPGPVASMPFLLEWLGRDLPIAKGEPAPGG